MKIKATVCITRNSNNEFNITIEDEASSTQFVDVIMSPHDFAMALSSTVMTGIDAEVRGLETVGKKCVMEKRSVVCPISYDRDAQQKWLIENMEEEGWTINPYLRSQSSIGRNEKGETVLNYSVYKFVDVEE